MYPHRYQINISGNLDEAGREAFGDFKIESGDMTTVLIADLDQAALYGALNRIISLGIEVLQLYRITGRGE